MLYQVFLYSFGGRPVFNSDTLCLLFTGLIFSSFSNWPLIKAYHMCLLFYWVDFGFSSWLNSNQSGHSVIAIILSVVWVHSVIYNKLKQTLFFGKFTEFILSSICDWPVNKLDTLCLIFKWIDFRFIRWLTRS